MADGNPRGTRRDDQGRPLMGVAIWTGLFAAFLAYQGFCLAAASSRWPPITEILRQAISRPVGRGLLFALWLWLGWHLFVRTLITPFRG